MLITVNKFSKEHADIILFIKRPQFMQLHTKYDYDMSMYMKTSLDKHNDNNIHELYEHILNVCIISAEESIPMVKTRTQREKTVVG